MPEIDDSIKLLILNATAQASKENLKAIQEVFAPLDGRLRQLESERLTEIGARGVKQGIKKAGLAIIPLIGALAGAWLSHAIKL